MNKEEYYTPAIEELCIGLEVYLVNIENAQWGKYTIEEWDLSTPNLGPGEASSSAITDLIDDLRNDNLRVKYLDDKDLEELGWVKGQYKLKGGHEIDVFYNKGCIITSNINHILDVSYVPILGSELSRIFRGRIKNKLELQRLMAQLFYFNDPEYNIL